jgi:hypothetical protein
MGPAFVAFGWMIVIGMAFVPVFIAAFFILRSAGRAFALAATFTAGAFAGFVGCGFLGAWLMQTRTMDPESTAYLIAFATAGAIGGGVLAVYILGKFAKYPPWRRY